VGKIIFWIVVFFLVLLALRLVSVHKTRQDEKERRDGESASDAKKAKRDDTPANEAMIKCSRCGVFVPKSTSIMTSTGLACNDSSCRHRPR
jgi:hypothetical protein